MSHGETQAYGLWGLAAINAAVFIIFAFSFFKPRTTRDWRSFGAFSAFLVALLSWQVLFRAQRSGTLACTGPYAHVRHPQYLAFIAIMVGFLLQWPTLLTALMFPVLVFMYVRLARREEVEIDAALGETWRAYARRTPRWIPKLTRADHLADHERAA